MGDRDDHLELAAENAALADQLSPGSPAEQRWAVVAAYYCLLHTAHAIAAERWGEHPSEHLDVLRVVTRVNPTRLQLKAELQESMLLSMNARYLNEGAMSKSWFTPYHTSSQEAVERAITLMRTVDRELRRIGGLPAP